MLAENRGSKIKGGSSGEDVDRCFDDGWGLEWDALECEVPIMCMARGLRALVGEDEASGIDEVPVKDGNKIRDKTCSAMEGLLNLVFARGCRQLAERLIIEGAPLMCKGCFLSRACMQAYADVRLRFCLHFHF